MEYSSVERILAEYSFLAFVLELQSMIVFLSLFLETVIVYSQGFLSVDFLLRQTF